MENTADLIQRLESSPNIRLVPLGPYVGRFSRHQDFWLHWAQERLFGVMLEDITFYGSHNAKRGEIVQLRTGQGCHSNMYQSENSVPIMYPYRDNSIYFYGCPMEKIAVLLPQQESGQGLTIGNVQELFDSAVRSKTR